MTDEELVKRLRERGGRWPVAAADRIDALTVDRDKAYASGYSDAETEISKSALGQSNTFLHSRYADAKLRIEALTVDRAEARAGWHKYEGAWMAAEGKLADVEAERDKLREALEPFAAKANGYDGIPSAKYWGDTSCVLRHYDDEVVSVTVGDLRKARAALKGETP